MFVRNCSSFLTKQTIPLSGCRYFNSVSKCYSRIWVLGELEDVKPSRYAAGQEHGLPLILPWHRPQSWCVSAVGTSGLREWFYWLCGTVKTVGILQQLIRCWLAQGLNSCLLRGCARNQLGMGAGGWRWHWVCANGSRGLQVPLGSVSPPSPSQDRSLHLCVPALHKTFRKSGPLLLKELTKTNVELLFDS